MPTNGSDMSLLDKFIVKNKNKTQGTLDLDFDNLEFSELALWRRLLQEVIISIGIRVLVGELMKCSSYLKLKS